MKIKYSLVCQLCKSKLTNKELTFFLFIARFQDKYGQIIGIYYKDIMEKCDMSLRTFYLVLKSLEKKGLIAFKRTKNDYDIKILNNDFSYEESYYEGYIDLNKNIFYSKKFNNLRVNEKLLLLILMRNVDVNKGQYIIGRKNFYDKYTKKLGVTKKVLRSYLHTLKGIFSIKSKASNFYIKVPDTILVPKGSATNMYREHIIQVGCRRNCIDVRSTREMQDTNTVIMQYRIKAEKLGLNIFEIFSSCIAKCKNSVLNSKYINMLIQEALGLAF